MNHYETLGVAKTATQDEIKQAFRKLSSQHHPDKGGDAEKFKAVSIANDVLRDPQKRAQYDEEIAGGGRQFHYSAHRTPPGQDRDMGNMDDILAHLRRQFGNNHSGFDPFSQFTQAQQRRSPVNPDVRITIQLDLVSTFAEQEKELAINIPNFKTETIKIKIPRGVRTGNTIRYPGLGSDQVPNAPKSDLYVQFQVRTPPEFEQRDIDLFTPLNINCLEAIVGCEKEVTGVDGKVFSIKIPPGVQYGAKFGIPEQGAYTTDHPGRGKLIVVLQIYIPKELTDEQLTIIRDIAKTL
jgi:DnaJ-class molecular chaperone